MTNGDRIRAMNDDKLAKFLYDVATHYAPRLLDIHNWLKQEAEDD